MLVDTHCHLYFDSFAGRQAEAAANMRAANVGAALVVGINAGTNADAAALCLRARAEGWPVRLEYSAGLHPAEPFAGLAGAGGGFDAAAFLAPWLSSDLPPVAIGECGVDLYWKKNPLSEQIAVFTAQLELGRRLGLPVIVHTREADSETLAAIESVPGSFGVLHCFNGSVAMTDFVAADYARGGHPVCQPLRTLLGSRSSVAAAAILLARLLSRRTRLSWPRARRARACPAARSHRASPRMRARPLSTFVNCGAWPRRSLSPCCWETLMRALG
jgi:Tat protein secretion system quality control protein TatD with DNase activity